MLHLDAEVHAMAARPTDRACLVTRLVCAHPGSNGCCFSPDVHPTHESTSRRAVKRSAIDAEPMTKAMCLSLSHLLLGARGLLHC